MQPVGTDAIVDLSHSERTIIIVGLMTGLMLTVFDSTVVATALSTVVGEFGGVDHLSWVVTAYLVASTMADQAEPDPSTVSDPT